jgi:acetyl esterase/lipase
MAAAVSQKLRDDSLEPGIKLQILVYPRVQSLDFQLPSMRQNVDAPLLKPSMSAFFASMYLGGDDSKVRALLANDHVSPKVKRAGLPFVDVSKLPSKYLVGYVKPSVDTGNETLWNELKGRLLNPYHSPLTAASLEDLPPAYVFSAEHDPLRDDAFLYASRLRESGVRVVHRHSDIGFHGVVTMAKMLPEAAEMLNDLTQFIVDNV